MPELDAFTRAYIECALWSSTDEDGEPLDAKYSLEDLAPETLSAMTADCAKFQEENRAAFDSEVCRANTRGPADLHEAAGHDFWLTRCGHGAGFWDGDWPEPYATTLDQAANRFGNVDLYVGDDGRIYA